MIGRLSCAVKGCFSSEGIISGRDWCDFNSKVGIYENEICLGLL